MAQGYLVDEASIKAMRDMRMRLGWEPLNRVGKRGRWPIGTGGQRPKFYRLTEDSLLYRGSHPDGAAAEEVAVDGVDAGRIVWRTLREDVTLYVGTLKGVYIQRDNRTRGNDPGCIENCDDDPEPPCPPNCTFTGNSPVATVSDAPAWWTLAASSSASNSNSTTFTARVFACEGYRIGGYDFATGEGEHIWLGVANEDITTQSYGNVTIDGIEVTASRYCSEGISSGSGVIVIYRELGGIGGFGIVAPLCCPGFSL